MAKGRLMPAELAYDERLARLELSSMTLFLLMLPHLDRDGLMDGRPLALWAKAAPLRLELREDAARAISAWVDVGLVVRYVGTQGEALLFVQDFRQWNSSFKYEREAPSKYPPPPGWVRTRWGLTPTDADLAFALAQNYKPESRYRKALEAAALPDSVESSSDPYEKLVRQSSGATPAEVRQNSGNSSDLVPRQDQDHNHNQYMNGGVGDHSRHSPTVLVSGGGVGEEGVTAVNGANSIADAGIDMQTDARQRTQHRGPAPVAAGHEDGPAEMSEAAVLEDAVHLLMFEDRDLRQAASEMGEMLNFPMEWTDFGGFLGGLDAAGLVVLLEWMMYYMEQRPEVHERIHSLPAVIRAHLKKGGRPALLTRQREDVAQWVLGVMERRVYGGSRV